MSRSLVFGTGIVCCAGVLCAVFALTSGALAQTTGSVNPKSDAPEAAAKDEPPPGACKPIGLTVSGEIVFPLECRDFIERLKAAGQKPPAAQDRPSVASEAKAAVPDTKPSVVDDKPASADAKPAPAEVKPAAEDNTASTEARTTTTEAKPAAADEKAPVEEKTAAKQSDGIAPLASKPAVEPAEAAPVPPAVPKRTGRETRERSAGPPGCTHFRSYDAASGTYLTFDGQRRPCREGGGELSRK